MTTEHVSVPHELVALSEAATPGPWRSMRDGNQWLDTEYMATAKPVAASRVDGPRRPWNPHAAIAFGLTAKAQETVRFTDADADFVCGLVNWFREAILSRATPSDGLVVNEASSLELVKEWRKRAQDTTPPASVAFRICARMLEEETLMRQKPSAPRVVTSEMVTAFQLAEMEYGERMQRSGIVFDPALSVEAGLAAALEFFATSLPAAIPPGYVVVPVEPNWDMRNEGREMLIDHCSKLDGDPERVAYVTWKAMLAAAPQAGERG